MYQHAFNVSDVFKPHRLVDLVFNFKPKLSIIPEKQLERQPEKLKETKASFAGCSLEERAEFPESTCLAPISVMSGKDHHGKRFSAMMSLINRSFKGCTLLICDTLYRHTLAIDYPELSKDDLYAKAKQNSQAWLKANWPVYSALNIPYKISFWDEYLNHPKFQEKYAIVMDLYNSNESYRNDIHTSVHEYLDRRLHREVLKVSYEQAFQASVDYLIEECIGSCLYTEGNYAFEVYPSKRIRALESTYERLIRPLHPKLLRPVSLRFK